MPDKETPTSEEETAQPVPDTQADLLTVPLAALEAQIRALESAIAEHVAPDAHNVLYAGLHERLSAVEQALTRIAGGSMQLQLGAPELEAIGNALRGHMTQTIFDVLKTHYGLNPPVVR